MSKDNKTPLVIIISSGRGPIECERAVVLFAAWLIQTLVSELSSAITCQTIEENPGQHSNTRTSISLEITALSVAAAEAVQAKLKFLIGTVQWICPSPYRSGHRRKNWFIQVSLAEHRMEANPVIAINPSDVRFETARSSGKGGQHVNKTETAVRAVHLPTGLAAIARDERSQLSNKKTALLRLEQRLAEQIDQARLRQKAELHHRHDQLQRGNAIASFVGLEFNPLNSNNKKENHG